MPPANGGSPAADTARRGRSRALAPPASAPVPALAETVEAMFLEEGLTLTDPATAHAFDVTMSAVVLLVQGAQEEGVLETDAYTILRRILDDMRATPTHL